MLTHRQLATDSRTLLRWCRNPPSIVCYGKPFRRSRRVVIDDDGVTLLTLAVCTTGYPGDTKDASEQRHHFALTPHGVKGALHVAAAFARQNP